MANEFVTLNPYDDQLEKLRQRQKMADLLQQQALQPLESQVAPGGYAVRTSPVLGLAKMLQAYMGGREQSNIDKELTGIREQMAYDQRQKEAEVASAGQAMMGRLTGERPTKPTQRTPTLGAANFDELGYEEAAPTGPRPIQIGANATFAPRSIEEASKRTIESNQLGEITPTAQYQYQYDPSGALQMAMTPTGMEAMKGNPLLASLLAQMVKPKEPEKFGTTPVQGADGNFYLVSESGRMVKTPVAGQVKTPEEPSSVREYKIAVGQGYKGSLMDFLTDQKRAGATKLSIDTGASNQLVGNFADELKESHKAAIASSKIMPQLNQLDKLTEQGTYTGAMAKGAVGASEFLQSFGINVDADTLARTKQFEALKNQLVLQMMAANGGARGFSKEETALLDNAFPQIVNNPQARKQIVQIFRNMAQAGIDQYNGQLNDFKRAYSTAVIPYQPIETEEMRYRRWKASQPGNQ